MIRFGDILQHVNNVAIVAKIESIEISRGLESDLMLDAYVMSTLKPLMKDTLDGLNINGYPINIDRSNHGKRFAIRLQEPILEIFNYEQRRNHHTSHDW